MDFSQIPELEQILNYSIGGVSVFAIIVAVYKLIKWLKTNNVGTAVNAFSSQIVGKEISIDLSKLTKNEFTEVKNEIFDLKRELARTNEAQSVVIADMADILLQSKLASDEQRQNLATHTESIRKYEMVKPKQVISVKLEPVVLPKTVVSNEPKIYVD